MCALQLLYAHTSLLGNGMTDPASMIESYYDMTCTAASVFPVLPIRFVEMRVITLT